LNLSFFWRMAERIGEQVAHCAAKHQPITKNFTIAMRPIFI
jgi:hypothetical protein